MRDVFVTFGLVCLVLACFYAHAKTALLSYGLMAFLCFLLHEQRNARRDYSVSAKRASTVDPVDSQPETGKERVDPLNKFVDLKKRVAERQAQYSKIAVMSHQQYNKYIHALEDEYDASSSPDCNTLHSVDTLPGHNKWMRPM